MKTQRTWQYLSLVALLGFWGCSTSRQTAQNTGEADDLYASSATALVYADSRQQYSEQPTERTTQTQRQRSTRNTNPEATNADENLSYNQNQDEYYSELTTRKLQRGISADPGWSSANDYNAGFVNGYNAGSMAYTPMYNSWSWNRWGYSPFSMGMSLGLGYGSMWGMSPWSYGGYGYGSSWGNPYYGSMYAYNPWNPWGYGGYGYYDPFYGGGYNSYWGGGWSRPVIVNNNVIVTGADPYRNFRNYGARSGSVNNRYNNSFVNSAPSYNPTGGRGASGSSNPSYSNSGASSSDGYYARPRQNSRGSYYYDNSSSASGGRTSANSTPSYSSPSYSSGSSSSDYYARPRQNSRGSSYTPPSSDYSSGGRTSTPTYSAPSYQSRSSYETPSYNRSSESYSRPSYSAPSQSQSTPSYNSGGSRGGGGYSGGSSSGGSSSGGGSRGPR